VWYLSRKYSQIQADASIIQYATCLFNLFFSYPHVLNNYFVLEVKSFGFSIFWSEQRFCLSTGWLMVYFWISAMLALLISEVVRVIEMIRFHLRWLIRTQKYSLFFLRNKALQGIVILMFLSKVRFNVGSVYRHKNKVIDPPTWKCKI
jgi:hypothetical protein